MKTIPKLKVIFVGALTLPANGARGGQLTATLNLFHSEIQDLLEWIPLSSTMESIPAPPLYKRAAAAMRRFFLFLYLLPQADVALIFSASGISLIEKTLMAVMARLAGRGVVMRISGGAVVAECERNPIMRWTLATALRVSHIICSQGKFWTDYFGQWDYARRKLVDAPNPMPIPADAPAGARTGARLLYAGWLTKEKGIFDLVPMFQQVLEKFPHARLAIAGGGTDAAQFRAALAAAGLETAVQLLGWVSPEQMQAEYRKSDVFVFPSYAEGMPNALLEAIVAGVPVVASHVGAIPDAVEDGVTGNLFAPGAVKAFTRHVLSALERPDVAAKMAREARERVAKRFDVERVWRAYARALNRAAYEAGRRPAILLIKKPQGAASACAAS